MRSPHWAGPAARDRDRALIILRRRVCSDQIQSMRCCSAILSALLQWNVKEKIATAFVCQQSPQMLTTHRHHHRSPHRSSSSSTALALDNDENDLLVEEARQLMAKAKEIRESLVSSSDKSTTMTQLSKEVISVVGEKSSTPLSDFTLPSHLLNSAHRLYIDIGREPGTWMEPRWGASGRRLEFTLDVSFLRLQLDDIASSSQEEEQRIVNDYLASDDIALKLISSTSSSKSSLSPIYALHSAPNARLLGGFDKMEMFDGGYCIESSSTATATKTMRFCLSVAGTTNGDISIPKGYLYFALPYFGIIQQQQQSVQVGNTDNNSTFTSQQKIMNLSSRDGTVTCDCETNGLAYWLV